MPRFLRPNIHFLWGWILILGLSLWSCKSNRQIIDDSIIYSYDCPDVIQIREMDTVEQARILKDSILTRIYNSTDLAVANAFGLVTDLSDYERLKIQIEEEGEDPDLLLQLFTASNRLNEGADLAYLELESTEDLIQCTTLQLGKFRSKVSEENLRSHNSLSSAAVIVGAATAILTAGILVSNNDQVRDSDVLDWMAVAGGVATAYLAIRATRVDKRVQLKPKNNFIRSIWNDDNKNNTFPPSTWYLLNHPFQINGQDISLREMIIQDWTESENMLADPEHKEYLEVLLQPDGIYTEEMIQLRIDMLDALVINLNQLTRALYLLNAKRY